MMNEANEKVQGNFLADTRFRIFSALRNYIGRTASACSSRRFRVYIEAKET